jgi:hypothetical protein
VYCDNRRELLTALGMELYRSVLPSGVAATAADDDEAADEEEASDGDAAAFDDAGDDDDVPVQPPQRQQQLVLHPAAARLQLGQPLQRVPVSQLLSLVPAKRKAFGAFSLSGARLPAFSLTTDLFPALPAPGVLPTTGGPSGGASSGVARPPGRPRRAPLPGRALLGADEVEELSEHGGVKALRAAYKWLYGESTASGNTTWLRNALCKA